MNTLGCDLVEPQGNVLSSTQALASNTAFGVRTLAYLIEFLEVSGEDPFVVLTLQRGHLHSQNALILGRKRLLHILDHTPQQVRPQLSVQLGYLHNEQSFC